VYSDDEAAALYDVLNTWGPSDAFYLRRVMAAPTVIDIGCGTGAILRRARESGHTGRLCGVDPDRAALDVARRRTDVEWVRATAATLPFDGDFELAIMTGHAFQVLIDDEEVCVSLRAIRRALTDTGRFAFETRNPGARAWETWNPSNAVEVVDPAGREIRVWHHVESVDGDIVTLTETTGERDGTPLRMDRARLRFPDRDTLAAFLREAGFEIESQFGGWDEQPLTPCAPEIITIAGAR
jgi:SAM-dependent methyltransferase